MLRFRPAGIQYGRGVESLQGLRVLFLILKCLPIEKQKQKNCVGLTSFNTLVGSSSQIFPASHYVTKCLQVKFSDTPLYSNNLHVLFFNLSLSICRLLYIYFIDFFFHVAHSIPFKLMYKLVMSLIGIIYINPKIIPNSKYGCTQP